MPFCSILFYQRQHWTIDYDNIDYFVKQEIALVSGTIKRNISPELAKKYMDKLGITKYDSTQIKNYALDLTRKEISKLVSKCSIAPFQNVEIEIITPNKM